MGHRSWWRLLVAIAASQVAVAGLGLPWARSALAGDRSGWSVLTGPGASDALAVVAGAAVAVAVVGTAAGRKFAGVAAFAAVVALGCVGWYGVQIATHSGAGGAVEPGARSGLGAGWFVTVAAVLVLALAAGGAGSRRRRSRDGIRHRNGSPL